MAFHAQQDPRTLITYSIDASEAGFPPGLWPEAVEFPSFPGTFRKHEVKTNEVAWEREVLWVDYRNEDGLEVRVYND
jgi:hypothetical protein